MLKKNDSERQVTAKSERSVKDQEAASELGVACHDVCGRIFAALGKGEAAQPVFSSAMDVRGAGVLCALPALIANGLFAHSQACLHQPGGYYSQDSLLLLYSFLALARVPSLERMRYLPPGEWGLFLGLDRIPEVKTARRKIDEMAPDVAAVLWAKEMSCFWMQLDEALAGVLYVDGHVRTYSGHQTQLPRRFSSRSRLCIRSLMDYWVNDQQGKPFFVVTAVGTEGMLHYLRSTIIPRLLTEVPGQPSETELESNEDLHRFVLVFDREGWSPAFFAELWRDHRIAIITYRKGNFQPWDENDFEECKVASAFGNISEMKLAERVFTHPELNAKSDEKKEEVEAEKDKVEGQWRDKVKAIEIRRSCDSKSHQTSIITTLRTSTKDLLASHMFSRWSQENYFKYASKELGIDLLAGYDSSEASPDQCLKNPQYVQADAAVRRNLATIKKVQSNRTGKVLDSNESQAVERYLAEQTALNEKLAELQKQRKELLEDRKNTPKHIKLSDIPEAQRPKLISHTRRQFLNTIRMIAYRAETALVTIIREHLRRNDDARALAKAMFVHDADLIFDSNAQTLTIRLHHFTNVQSSKAVYAVLQQLNQAEIDFPATKIRLKYEMVSNPNPVSQDL